MLSKNKLSKVMEIEKSSSKDTTSINIILVVTFNDHNIEIYGSWIDPLFKIQDIGKILDIKNIISVIENFDSEYKKMYTINNQETVMLTELGLYNVLYEFENPIVYEFHDYICPLMISQRSKFFKEFYKKIENDCKNDYKIQIVNQKEKFLLERLLTYTENDEVECLKEDLEIKRNECRKIERTIELKKMKLELEIERSNNKILNTLPKFKYEN